MSKQNTQWESQDFSDLLRQCLDSCALCNTGQQQQEDEEFEHAIISKFDRNYSETEFDNNDLERHQDVGLDADSEERPPDMEDPVSVDQNEGIGESDNQEGEENSEELRQ
ncbi:hypothetical protein OTU49_000513 [Cherax quadricarinatus]|uniref:Uncharacterized protein n=1 Tax=Cherax quadricarinatus TaxID=27406 RepID=A0AAW0XZP8_CHEQU